MVKLEDYPRKHRPSQKPNYEAAPPTFTQALALRQARHNVLTAVQGPPGTGKTTLILSLVAQQIVTQALDLMQGQPLRNRLTLLTSTNNRAVDDAVERLAKAGVHQPFLLTGGSRAKITKMLVPALQEAIDKIEVAEFRGRAWLGLQNRASSLRATLSAQPWNPVKGDEESAYQAWLASFRDHLRLFKVCRRWLWFEVLKRRTDVLESLRLFLDLYTGDQGGQAKRRLAHDYERHLGHLALVFPVISSTLHSVRNLMPLMQAGVLDLVIVDEAGMILCHQLCPTLVRANRAVVVGDPKQIEPIVALPTEFIDGFHEQQFKACGLDERDIAIFSPASIESATAFHRASGVAAADDCGKNIFLREHFRCQKPIAEFIRELAYEGLQVLTPPADPVWKGKHLVAFDVCGRSEDGVNRREIEAVDYIVQQLRDLGCSLASKPENDGHSDIGIITPYRKQAAAFCKHFHFVDKDFPNYRTQDIGTVHRFQGGQWKVVILSTRVSEPHDSLQFLNRRVNLLNVAVSRAQQLFVLVGNLAKLDDTFPHEPRTGRPTRTQQLVRHIQRTGVIVNWRNERY